MSCGGKMGIIRVTAWQWSCTMRRILEYLGWPLFWAFNMLGTRASIWKYILSGCKTAETLTVAPILTQLCVNGIDFSFPTMSNILVTCAQTSKTSAAWFISFVDDHCTKSSERNKKLKETTCDSLCMDVQITSDVCPAIDQLSCCEELQTNLLQFAKDICAPPDCQQSDGTLTDSDYSDTESVDEDDSCDSEESDDDFSVVFDDMTEDLSVSPNIVMSFQTCKNSLIFDDVSCRSSSVIFEDVPSLCFHEIMTYSEATYDCQDTASMSVESCASKINVSRISASNMQGSIICCTADAKAGPDASNTSMANQSEKLCQKRKASKNVCFATDEQLVTIHPMIQWAHAYHAARKGHWETFVSDRAHFRRRIKQFESILDLVLENQYRKYLNSC